MFLLRDFADLWLRPATAVLRIRAERRVRDGLLAGALGLMAPAVLAELAGFLPYHPPAELSTVSPLIAPILDVVARWSYAQRFLLPLAGLVAGLLFWVAGAAIIHGLARAMGGRGSLTGFSRFVGMTALAGLITLPLSVVGVMVHSGAAASAASLDLSTGMLTFGVVAWQTVLLVWSAQAHYGVSMRQAVTAVIGPASAVIALLLLLGVATSLVLLGATRPAS